MRRLLPAVACAACMCVAAPGSALALSGVPYQWGSQAGSTPTAVPGLTEVTQIDAGNGSGYALKAGGTVWAWGKNKQGQLGDGKLHGRGKPARVLIPEHVKIVSIGEAKDEGFAIDSEGHGWVWGLNVAGSACLPSSERDIPTPVELKLSDLVAVQGGNEHSLWITASGHVLACGSNEDGVLGLGKEVQEAEAPTEVPGLSNVVEVSAGVETSAARTATGELFAWGSNKQGAVGTDAKARIVYTPQKVTIPSIKSVSAGGGGFSNGAMLAVTSTDQLWGWGDNTSGQIPGNDENFVRTPFDTGLQFTQVAAGGLDGIGLTAKGEVLTWGSAEEGDLGNGMDTGIVTTPVKVDEGAVQVSTTAKNAMDLH